VTPTCTHLAGMTMHQVSKKASQAGMTKAGMTEAGMQQVSRRASMIAAE